MTVRELLGAFEEHRRNIQHEQERLISEVSQGITDRKKARRLLFSAIKKFVNDFNLFISFQTAFESAYNKNGVSIEHSTIRHRLFEMFYLGIYHMTGMDVDEGIEFGELSCRVDEFFLEDCIYLTVMNFLGCYFMNDLDEIITCDCLLVKKLGELDGDHLPNSDHESTPKPWSSSDND